MPSLVIHLKKGAGMDMSPLDRHSALNRMFNALRKLPPKIPVLQVHGIHVRV